MSLTENIGKIVLVTSLIASVPLNYYCGFKPAYNNVASGMTSEESENNLQAIRRREYCDENGDICDVGILIDPMTIPGRVLAYTAHKIFE